MNSIIWIRIGQALLLLICLLATIAVCYVGIMARKRADSRGKKVRYILFGGGLGLLFGISLSTVFLLEQMMTQGAGNPSPIGAAAQFFCCSTAPVFIFAAAVMQFLWLRQRRRWRR